MLITHQKGFIFPNQKIGSSSFGNATGSYSNVLQRTGIGLLRILAKRRDLPDRPREQNKPIFTIKVQNTFLARSVVAVLGLGFIDAGYSGDWSRIQVISAETENLLKAAAFLVVPLCLLLALSFYEESDA